MTESIKWALSMIAAGCGLTGISLMINDHLYLEASVVMTICTAMLLICWGATELEKRNQHGNR